MLFTPGIDLVTRTLLDFLIPCSVTYPILTISCTYLLASELPRWIFLVSSLGLRLGYILAKPEINEYRNSRAARACGAALAPHVRENQFRLAKILLHEIEDGYPCETFRKLSQKYGTSTYRFNVGPDELHFTTEPEHIKSILATEFDSFEKGPNSFSEKKSLLGTGVFNSDGEMWRFHRSITRPFFTKDRISDFDNFERHSEEALKRARARLSEGYPIDFQDLVARFTLDSATEFLFKHDIRSLDAQLPYPAQTSPADAPLFTDHPSDRFVKAFVTSQEMIFTRAIMGTTWPLLEFWKDAVKPHRDILDQCVQPFLENGFEDKERRVADSGSSAESLLDHLTDKISDQNVIKDEIINLLVAGRDTTSSLLTFSLYMLIEHPDIEQRLRKEVLEKVGPEHSPTSEDIRELKYLRAFLNEVLRLYPIVPLNGRLALSPVIFTPRAGSDTPLYIPTGARCVYSVYLMHRRTDLWGPDALEFDPDRFLDERLHKYLIPNPFIFCPFNAGPRICLGQQFAYNEASFFLICLLQQFTSFSLDIAAMPMAALPKPEWVGIEGPQGKDRIRFKNALTMYVKGGLWVKMKEVA